MTEDVEKYEQNIEKAKQLLAEAGVSNLTANLGYSSSDAAQTLQATLIQQQLAAIGVTVELAGGDSTALFTELKKKVLQHMTSSWVATSWEMTLIGMLVCLKLVVLQTTLNWQQARLTVSLNKVLLNWIETKREQIYDNLQATLVDQAAIYPIVDNKKFWQLTIVLKMLKKLD